MLFLDNSFQKAATLESLMENKDYKMWNTGSLMSGKTISASALVNQISALAIDCQ